MCPYGAEILLQQLQPWRQVTGAPVSPRHLASSDAHRVARFKHVTLFSSSCSCLTSSRKKVILKGNASKKDNGEIMGL